MKADRSVAITVMLAAAVALGIWNERRPDLSRLAASASVVPPNVAGAAGHAGELVSVTGSIQGSEPVGDFSYIRPAGYVIVLRTTEMYSWVEHAEHPGATPLRYRYTREWREMPPHTGDFRHPAGHVNPDKRVLGGIFGPSSAAVGTHRLEVDRLALPLEDVELSADRLLPNTEAKLASPDYLYLGDGNLEAPQIGDVRVRYSALKRGALVTVFGRMGAHGELSEYIDAHGGKLYRAVEGTRDAAISGLREGSHVLTWLVRLLASALAALALGLLAMRLRPVGGIDAYEPPPLVIPIELFATAGAAKRRLRSSAPPEESFKRAA